MTGAGKIDSGESIMKSCKALSSVNRSDALRFVRTATVRGTMISLHHFCHRRWNGGTALLGASCGCVVLEARVRDSRMY